MLLASLNQSDHLVNCLVLSCTSAYVSNRHCSPGSCLSSPCPALPYVNNQPLRLLGLCRHIGLKLLCRHHWGLGRVNDRGPNITGMAEGTSLSLAMITCWDSECKTKPSLLTGKSPTCGKHYCVEVEGPPTDIRFLSILWVAVALFYLPLSLNLSSKFMLPSVTLLYVLTFLS